MWVFGLGAHAKLGEMFWGEDDVCSYIHLLRAESLLAGVPGRAFAILASFDTMPGTTLSPDSASYHFSKVARS